MIVDTSALVAILLKEPDHPAILQALLDAPSRRVGAPNWLELRVVLDARLTPGANAAASQLLGGFEIEVVPFDATMAELARGAYRRYGRGRHPAKLNFGDCMAYALARATDEPLLFKGNDFSQTDITPALA